MNESKLEIVRPNTVDPSVFDGDLKAENAALRERQRDLDAQIQTLQASRLIAPHEEEAIAEKSRAFDEINNTQNRIVKVLRDSFPESLGTGSIAQIVIGLLDELKAHRAAKAKPGFWARVFGA